MARALAARVRSRRASCADGSFRVGLTSCLPDRRICDVGCARASASRASSRPVIDPTVREAREQAHLDGLSLGRQDTQLAPRAVLMDRFVLA